LCQVTVGSVRAMATATWGLDVTGEMAVTGWRETLAGSTRPGHESLAGITTSDRLNHPPPKGCWFVHRRLPACAYQPGWRSPMVGKGAADTSL